MNIAVDPNTLAVIGIVIGVVGTLFVEMALVLATAIGYAIYTSKQHTPRKRGNTGESTRNTKNL